MSWHTSMLPGLLALGLAWGSSPAAAQFPRYTGLVPYTQAAPGQPYADPYYADRPAYPYGPQGYGSPYDPRGSSRPALPEDPPYGFDPSQGGFGPPMYRESYRPPFPEPRPGAFPGFGPAPGPRSPIIGGSPQLLNLSDTLVGQVNDFLRAFATTVDVVPEGRGFLADAQALGEAAGRFRQLAASGIPPALLSQELRAVEETWQRLSQRTQRIARGRTGPNIQQVALMGETLRQMRRFLP